MPKVDMVILDGEAIDRARRARLMTLPELGAATGLAHGTIWAARTGRPVALTSARKIAAPLGLDLRRLMQDAPERVAEPALGAVAGIPEKCGERKSA